MNYWYEAQPEILDDVYIYIYIYIYIYNVCIIDYIYFFD